MKRIVVTGPESTGKTLLAEALAAALEWPLAPEFARDFVAHMGRPYGQSDLEAIGRGQRLWEDRAAGNAVKGWIADTDWTVLEVWEYFRFGKRPGTFWQQGYGDRRTGGLYLLCSPDFPWAPDPLREHPESREVLFDLYEGLLLRHGVVFHVLRGGPGPRLEKAHDLIRKFS